MASALTFALIPKRMIEVPDGGEFAVRGLSPSDAFSIYSRHAGELGQWFEKLQAGTVELSIDAAPALASSLMKTAPALVAEIIAAAAGEGLDEEAIQVATQLSVSVQASALEAIGELTFTQEMPPKKLLEIVVKMAGNLSGSATPAT